MNEQLIKHEGVVCSLNDDVARIRLINISTCSSCHAKVACSVSELDNKTVEVQVNRQTFAEGDHVKVLFNDSLGFKALLLGYVFPFFVMLIALFTAWVFTRNETYSGLIALLILVVRNFWISFLTKTRKILI